MHFDAAQPIGPLPQPPCLELFGRIHTIRDGSKVSDAYFAANFFDRKTATLRGRILLPSDFDISHKSTHILLTIMTRQHMRNVPVVMILLVALAVVQVAGFNPSASSSSARQHVNSLLASSSFGDAIPTVGGSTNKNKGDWQDGNKEGEPKATEDVHSVAVAGSSTSQVNVSDEIKEKGEEEVAPSPPPSNSSDRDTNPASTTPQLLAGIWTLINEATRELTRGETRTVMFPNMAEYFVSNPTFVDRLVNHLDICKDVCDEFGVNTVLVPYADEGGRVLGFTAKSYRNLEKITEDGDYIFEDDPYWDDSEDWDSLDAEIAALVEAEEDDESVAPVTAVAAGLGEFGEPMYSTKPAGFAETAKLDAAALPEIENPIPDDDAEIIAVSKAWTQKMMADLGICPFTADADKSGMPVGPVYYAVDRSKNTEDVYESYWKMVVKVEENDQKDLATTLHIFPEFCMENVEAFENFSNTLTQPLEILGVEDLLQLVFFHPYWTFRDGGDRGGAGAAANYARRSPWPMINILRTNQVRAAQKGIPTGLVYQQNEKTLDAVGATELEAMLRKRDWSAVEELRVNRRDMEALRIAQDYKETGEVAAEDRDLVHDATPKANKVDQDQLEGGDVVKVVLQAINKRLEGGPDGGVQRLSGPETSATMMASDFLLQRLRELESK